MEKIILVIGLTIAGALIGFYLKQLIIKRKEKKD